MYKVETKEICFDEWKLKLLTSPDEWLLKQYNGLKYLLNMLTDEVDTTYNRLRGECGGESIGDELYATVIAPMENELLDIDAQLVSVEDELYKRGIEVLGEDDER